MPNASAIKNARDVVLTRRLVGLFRSADGTLLLGDCKGNPDSVSEVWSEELSEQEKKKLDKLSGFNFEEL